MIQLKPYQKNKHYKRIQGLKSLIGNTPLLELHFTFHGDKRIVFAKAENFNMTGSIKDRMAFHIVLKAYERGDLQPGHTIIEVTSGNTGIAFCAIGRALGHPVKIFMPEWMSQERINIMKSLGADVRLVSKAEGGFLGSIKLAEEEAESTENTFLPRQFSNEDNVEAHYLTTGPEIWWQLQYHKVTPDAFIAGVGTGGTIMGAGKYLKEKNSGIKICPVEPSNSPTLSTGHKVGKHRIQGISDEFIPSIMDLGKLDKIISIDDGDAILMAQKLASEIGIGVGISSGANFLGALQVQNELGEGKIVVTVFPDDNKKYLSTDLLREEMVKDSFLSPKIKLQSFRALNRVCHTCCDPIDCMEKEFDELPLIDNLPYCPKRH